MKKGLITNLYDYPEYTNVNANIKTDHLSSTQLTKIARKMNARFLLERGSLIRLFRKFPAHIVKRMLIELFQVSGKTENTFQTC